MARSTAAERLHEHRGKHTGGRKHAGVAGLLGAGAATGCAGTMPTNVASCGAAAGTIPGATVCHTCKMNGEDDTPRCWDRDRSVPD